MVWRVCWLLRKRRHSGGRHDWDERQNVRDNYRTPHTTQLHVVERFRLVDGGEGLEINVRVEDPGAFTVPWNAVQRYKRDRRPWEVPLHEMVCAENNGDHFNQSLYPLPQADRPDF